MAISCRKWITDVAEVWFRIEGNNTRIRITREALRAYFDAPATGDPSETFDRNEPAIEELATRRILEENTSAMERS